MKISRCFVAVFFLSCFASVAPEGLVAQTICDTGTCVATWHNDTYRTGQNLAEGTLTYNTINKDNFGQLCLTGESLPSIS